MSKPKTPSASDDSSPTLDLPAKEVCWTLLLREQEDTKPSGLAASSSNEPTSSRQSEPATDVAEAYRLGAQLFRELAKDVEPEPPEGSGPA